ncbi:Flp family type IVb pilin [Sinomonas atrocyanea]|uniref:Flp family type IVb pilin n=1 Tax=Sinomonas atrocyanea TaxID=37927 RepID=UPI003D9593B5
MNKFLVTLVSFWNDVTNTEKEKGATATEYALLVAFIALAIVAGVTAFGVQLNTFFEGLGAAIGIL